METQGLTTRAYEGFGVAVVLRGLEMRKCTFHGQLFTSAEGNADLHHICKLASDLHSTNTTQMACKEVHCLRMTRMPNTIYNA